MIYLPIPHKTKHHLTIKCCKSIHVQYKKSTCTSNLQNTAIFKRLVEKGIMLKKNDKLLLEAYINADYIGSVVNRNLLHAFVSFLMTT